MAHVAVVKCQWRVFVVMRWRRLECCVHRPVLDEADVDRCGSRANGNKLV